MLGAATMCTLQDAVICIQCAIALTTLLAKEAFLSVHWQASQRFGPAAPPAGALITLGHQGKHSKPRVAGGVASAAAADGTPLRHTLTWRAPAGRRRSARTMRIRSRGPAATRAGARPRACAPRRPLLRAQMMGRQALPSRQLAKAALRRSMLLLQALARTRRGLWEAELWIV